MNNNQINNSSSMYDLIREDYRKYGNAPKDIKQDLIFSRDALLECIAQCNDKDEDHRRRIYSDFSKYVSEESGIKFDIIEKNGPRVIIKKKKSLRSLFIQ